MPDIQDDIFKLLHLNTRATAETLRRGCVVYVWDMNLEEDLALCVVENAETAKKLFNMNPKEITGIIEDDPGRFGLRHIRLSELPKPIRSELTAELKFEPKGKEQG